MNIDKKYDDILERAAAFAGIDAKHVKVNTDYICAWEMVVTYPHRTERLVTDEGVEFDSTVVTTLMDYTDEVRLARWVWLLARRELSDMMFSLVINGRRHEGHRQVGALVANHKRFEVHRFQDTTGVSGTGHVADGLEFEDGTAVIHWRTPEATTTIYKSMDDVKAIHCHDDTIVIFND